MWSTYGCKIQQSGSSGSYTYSVAADYANRPVNYVSWYDALRFVNWLENGQPTGTQTDATTEDGVYDMDAALTRQAGADFFLPTEDEWYKAAYYKGGGKDAGYWDYPTGSDTAPTAEAPPGTDLTNGSANYYSGGFVDPTYYTTPVGAYTGKPSTSPYGTFDQGGNVWEWNETAIGSFRGVRGSSFHNNSLNLRASNRLWYDPAGGLNNIGFRVASAPEPTGVIPEPSSIVVWALGLGLVWWRRKAKA